MDVFHKDLIGAIKLVRDTPHKGSFFECKTGESILKSDCKKIKNENSNLCLLMGFWKHYLGSGPEIKIGRDCDVKVLEDCEEIQIEAPEDFKAFIDSNK